MIKDYYVKNVEFPKFDFALKIRWFVWQLKMRSENLVKPNYQKQYLCYFWKVSVLFSFAMPNSDHPILVPQKRER